MIEITKKNTIKPHFQLSINYIVGEFEGDTRISNKISIENPFLERFCNLLNKLEPLKEKKGIIFTQNKIISVYNKG